MNKQLIIEALTEKLNFHESELHDGYHYGEKFRKYHENKIIELKVEISLLVIEEAK